MADRAITAASSVSSLDMPAGVVAFTLVDVAATSSEPATQETDTG